MNSDQLIFYCVPAIGHGISYIRRVKLLQYFKVKTTMGIPFLYIVCVIYRTIQQYTYKCTSLRIQVVIHLLTKIVYIYIEQKIRVLFETNILRAVHKNTYSLIAIVLVVRFICKIRIMALL